jgi:osmotically-inducible protein OsmY
MSDKHLKQEILDVFQWDPRIATARIGVAVENGIVTLTGAVGTDDERIAAEEALRHVAGVRDLLQKIEVQEGLAGASWRGRTDFELGSD